MLNIYLHFYLKKSVILVWDFDVKYWLSGEGQNFEQ